jgi:hypothetical protein
MSLSGGFVELRQSAHPAAPSAPGRVVTSTVPGALDANGGVGLPVKSVSLHDDEGASLLKSIPG